MTDPALATADELLGRRQDVLAAIETLLPAGIDADKARHHGDLHLGQILMVKDDAFIIDFEGEPQRSQDERLRKASPVRDVAGMIRSLDYAAVATLHRVAKGSPEEGARLEAFLDVWRREATTSLLAGVREGAAAGQARLWPQDSEIASRLLRFFLVEKATYEIGYELANRPDWIAVPTAGVLRTLFPGEHGQ